MMLAKSVRLMMKAPQARFDRAAESNINGPSIIKSRKSKDRERTGTPCRIDMSPCDLG